MICQVIQMSLKHMCKPKIKSQLSLITARGNLSAQNLHGQGKQTGYRREKTKYSDAGTAEKKRMFLSCRRFQRPRLQCHNAPKLSVAVVQSAREKAKEVASYLVIQPDIKSATYPNSIILCEASTDAPIEKEKKNMTQHDWLQLFVSYPLKYPWCWAQNLYFALPTTSVALPTTSGLSLFTAESSLHMYFKHILASPADVAEEDVEGREYEARQHNQIQMHMWNAYKQTLHERCCPGKGRKLQSTTSQYAS